ncbi:MAG: thioesterase family protein [Ascidiaceihabitans sp.]|nr:thioesterase family protein [Ascidiaceihabitans sp.]
MTDAPFRSSTLTVRPEWIDYNGHLNMAYYSVLMDQCADQAYPIFGFGPDYLSETGCTTYVAEFHVCYVRELHVNDPVQITFQLLDYDEKRFHVYQEIWHNDGWLAATGEALTLHVDQSGPKVAPMPQTVLSRIETMYDAHKGLPRPDRAGRSIGIKRKS